MAQETIDPQLIQLLEFLLEGTRSGTVVWSPAAENSFTFAGSQSGVTLRSFTDSEDDTVISLVLQDSEGRNVEVFEGRWQFSSSRAAPVSEFDTLLEELYPLARRSALKIDVVLGSLLNDLRGNV